ncbi:hypothetical protein LGH70_11620 [Hymenobacter sp. BT635]|uniref:DUF4365 domain-containing protein n=1 Tax=Hymenobacter nitidus TaxID=2880929 RepID=A0ABS8AET3_9BACT|nr:hypothetical protein [Hymenobacter nitidus]MCB2378237.1 hypothetical protein [Hymenobacter nitidus]
MTSINVSAIYSEAGVNFPISYLFMRLLREQLAQLEPQHHAVYQAKYGLDFTLGIILSAKSNTSQLEIKGPSLSKKYKVVDDTLYIPFVIAEEAETFYSKYVSFVCTGVSTVLEKFLDAGVVKGAVAKFRACALEQQTELFQAEWFCNQPLLFLNHCPCTSTGMAKWFYGPD